MAGGDPSGGIVDSVVSEMNRMNDEYYEQIKEGINALVDSKVAVHAHDKILDDQIDEFKGKIGAIEGNIQAMDQENDDIRKILGDNQPQNQVTAGSIDEQVKPANALSEKLINLQAKNVALEDAMGVLKKAFDNDSINMEEYLKSIRTLAKK